MCRRLLSNEYEKFLKPTRPGPARYRLVRSFSVCYLKNPVNFLNTTIVGISPNHVLVKSGGGSSEVDEISNYVNKLGRAYVVYEALKCLPTLE